MRIDSYLFEKGFAQSRQKAQELIAKKVVYCNQKLILKNSLEVLDQDEIEIIESKQWVARSGEKLEGFLKHHYLPLQDVLDIGSSTGGFSEVLLHYGAERITCVDVGSNQLHHTLKNHPKITFFENQDIRTFQSPPFTLVVCDVSFISLRLIIDKIYSLTKQECLLLFKPQFEVGKHIKRDKKGVIQDKKAVQESLESFLKLCQDLGFILQTCEKSLIKGKNGNEEFFIHLTKPRN